MIQYVVRKVLWVGRATTFGVGLAVILAVVFGLGATALAAVPGDPLRLGRLNSVDRLTALVGNVSGATLRVENSGAGTALELRVGDPAADPAAKSVPPMRINSQAKVENLNADELDSRDSDEFLMVNGKAADSEKLNGMGSYKFMQSDTHYREQGSGWGSSTTQSANVYCPSGKRAISGGAEIIIPEGAPANPPVAITAVRNRGYANWSATATEMSPYDEQWGVSVHAMCVTDESYGIIYPQDER